MRALYRLSLFVLAALAATGAYAANQAGNAVAVIQQATADLEGVSGTISTGDGIFMGQQLVTGNEGQVEIVFRDETRLVVGPGSTLVISEYLMRNDNTASKFVVDALAGTFRFATGNSPKNAYEINTPTGTMGVRGTWFDFSIDPATGETAVILYEGGVQMCGKTGRCVVLAETCGVGVMAQRTAANILIKQMKPPKLKGFPYLNSQRPLRRDFRVRDIADCKVPERKVASVDKPVVDDPPVVTPPPPDPDPEPEPEPEPEPSHDHDQHDGNGNGQNNPGAGNGNGHDNDRYWPKRR